jgi:hypothetical protein
MAASAPMDRTEQFFKISRTGSSFGTISASAWTPLCSSYATFVRPRPLFICITSSMESNNCRISSADSTGVLPRVTTYLGPRTEPAGLDGRIPPVTR